GGVGGVGGGGGEGGVRGVMGKILGTGEEADEGAALPRDVVADRAAEGRITRFEGVEDGPGSHRRRNVELDLSPDLREGAQVRRELHPDHRNGRASAERNAARSRT